MLRLMGSFKLLASFRKSCEYQTLQKIYYGSDSNDSGNTGNLGIRVWRLLNLPYGVDEASWHFAVQFPFYSTTRFCCASRTPRQIEILCLRD